jgi:hypothetical protein
MVTRLLVLFALVSAAAALGFTGGRASEAPADPRGTWDDGYHAGVTAQRNAAPAAADRVRSRYAPGADGYEKIYDAGLREGRRLGRIQGATDARAEALPNFAGGWRASHWYMVKFEATSSARSVRIAKRVIVARGRLYGPCRANADDICAVPQN